MSISLFKNPKTYYNTTAIIYIYKEYVNNLIVGNLTVDTLILKNVMIDNTYNNKLLYVNNGKIAYKDDYMSRVSILENKILVQNDRIIRLEEIIRNLINK